MSASALLSTGTTAIFSAYRQVETASNNIANANTEGYSRQKVDLQTAAGESTGDGYIGRGVTVSTVTRASNQFLTTQTNALTSASATDTVRADLLDQLQQVFGQSGTGLGNAATEVFSAYNDLAAAPSDLSARQAVLGRLEDFASLARATGDRVDEVQKQVQDDLRSSVDVVNGTAKALAKLNVQISTAANSGHAPNDLLDQRDLLVGRLAEQLELHTVMGSDGQASVFLSSGEALVIGNDANSMQVQADQLDSSRLRLAINLDVGTTLLSRSAEGEGRIPGLLKTQNDDLVAARNDLGQLVTSMAMTLNSQQQRGLDMTGTQGSVLFNIASAPVTAAASNARDASGVPISGMTMTVTDPTALQASDYLVEADADNPGTYIVTRQRDGVVRSGVASGDVVDGFQIANGDVVPSAGERFMFKPVAGAASSLSLALRNPQGLAAANPVVASAATSNVGTLAVAKVDITAQPASGSYQALTLRFTDNAGSYTIEGADGATLATGTYTAGQAISYDGMAVSLSGLPKTDDKINLAPTVHIASSNGNALTMQGLGTLKLVGGQTAADAFAATLSDMGVRTQSAQASASNSSAALQRTKAQLTGEVGVNLDEEAARLIQYQQSYQAAAKVLQTAQTLLDTVIQLAA